MKRNIRAAISKLLRCKIRYEDSRIELASGESASIFDSENVSMTEGADGVTLYSEVLGCAAELRFLRSDGGAVSVSFKITPSAECGSLPRRVISAIFSTGYGEESRIFFNTPERKYENRISALDRTTYAEYVLSLFELGQSSLANSFINKLPNKFHSNVKITKKRTRLSLEIATVIPFSYRGEILASEWLIYPECECTEAITHAAESFGEGETFEAPVGWSTWDYYFTSATEDDVRENVDFIANDPVLSERIKYIALDDGWQQREGDWREGIRYPGGLKTLVSYINEKGFDAGIWIAPTRLHYLSGTVMRRYDFLIRGDYDDPIIDIDMYVLDPTHPDGEKFLRETFSYLADCGFTFYKLDFISNMLKADRFYDTSAGPYDALRRLFEIVRETVPRGSHIMGCSLPYGMGAKVADSRRTGMDIHNTFGHLKMCTYLYQTQFAANERIYRNDLDYLVVRGSETSDDPMTNVLFAGKGHYAANPTKSFRWRAGPDFSYNEAKCWCTVMIMSGSSIFLGDNLPRLNGRGLELIRKTLSATDFHAATPVVDGGEIIPEIWYKKESGGLYVFNLSDEVRHYDIPVSEIFGQDGTFRDAFSEKEYSSSGGRLSVTLDMHDCLCLSKI